MSEGLSPTEVGREVGEHAKHTAGVVDRHQRLIVIGEAVLLSIVTCLLYTSDAADE